MIVRKLSQAQVAGMALSRKGFYRHNHGHCPWSDVDKAAVPEVLHDMAKVLAACAVPSAQRGFSPTTVGFKPTVIPVMPLSGLGWLQSYGPPCGLSFYFSIQLSMDFVRGYSCVASSRHCNGMSFHTVLYIFPNWDGAGCIPAREREKKVAWSKYSKAWSIYPKAWSIYSKLSCSVVIPEAVI